MKLSVNSKLLVLIVVFQLVCNHVINAQDSDILILSGIVTSNSKEKLTGVNVYIKGTTKGTVSDENGHYSIKLTEGSNTVVFSFIGCQTQERTINLRGNRTLNIILEQNEEILQEISVSSQRKFFGNMDYGREIPTIKSEEFEKLNSSNASDILHARLAGVWATKTSGAPGDQQKIRIRGQASFFSSSEPLYVIDGVPVPIVNLSSLGIGDLNINDIESVTVLKDASSTALYGYQGSNGVVLIDTKQKSDDRLRFFYRQGVQWLNNYYDLMNTKEFYESIDLAGENIRWNTASFYPDYSDTLSDHNRQEEIFQLGNHKEYQLNGGGKLKNSTYYLSGGYYKHDGIVIGTSQEKYNFTARTGTNFGKKLALSFSYRWSYQKNANNINEYKGNSLIFQGLPKAPCLESIPSKLLKPSNSINLYNRMLTSYYLLNDTITPEIIRNTNHHSMNYSSNAFSLMGRYQFNEHLGINIIESLMRRNSTFDNNSKVYKVLERNNNVIDYPVNYNSKENVALINHQANLSYNRRFGAHQAGLSAAHRYYTDNLSWTTDTINYLIPDHFYIKNSMASYGREGSVIRMLNSYILHANYNYANKYFISAIAHLGKIHQGTYINNLTLFPSVSLSWDVAKEHFMAPLSWLNVLNVYSNYGSSGNFPLIGSANDIVENPYYFWYRVSPTNYFIKQLSNHYLEQERNKELDFGFKTEMFMHRLSLSGAWYTKVIDKQIVNRNIPIYYGSGQYYINFGDMQVKGYELNLEGRLIERKHTNWQIRANLAHTEQHVLKLAEGEELQFLSDDILFPSFIIKEGQALGDIYGYEYLGKWTNEDKEARDIHVVNVNEFKYAKVDTTNKKLSEKDLKVIGNSIPDYTWNFSSSFQYMNFGLDVVVYSALGVQKYNATRAGIFVSGVSKEVLPFYQDSLTGVKGAPFYSSSYFIEDASFIKIKTLALSYRIPEILKGVECMFTLNLENFLTFTKYQGYDPESTIFTDNNFSDNAIDRGAYPNPRSVSVGISLKL